MAKKNDDTRLSFLKNTSKKKKKKRWLSIITNVEILLEVCFSI